MKCLKSRKVTLSFILNKETYLNDSDKNIINNHIKVINKYIDNDDGNLKFKSYYIRKGQPDRATIQFLSRKALRPRSTVNINKLRTMKKTIMNTRKRQKNRRAETVKRKRNTKKNNADDLSVLFSGLFK